MSSNPLVAKFTQLWFACYFERRLTRQKIESADLKDITDKLREYIGSQGSKLDFRRAVPLLQGLHVLYCKKLGLLLRDSSHTLKNMSEPIEVIKLEAGIAGE